MVKITKMLSFTLTSSSDLGKEAGNEAKVALVATILFLAISNQCLFLKSVWFKLRNHWINR